MKITSAKFTSDRDDRLAIVTFDDGTDIVAMASPFDVKPLNPILRLLRTEREQRLRLISINRGADYNHKRVAELDRLIPLLETEQFFLG